MQKTYTILLFVCLTLLLNNLQAITYTFNGNGSWSDPPLWHPHPPIGNMILPGDVVEITAGSQCTIEPLTFITNSGTINNRGTLINYGTINGQPTGLLNNFSLIENIEVIHNRRGMFNFGRIENTGEVNNHLESSFHNITNVGIFNNNGGGIFNVNDNSILDNQVGSYFNNKSGSKLNNKHTINNFGNISNAANSTIKNFFTGTINNLPEALIENKGGTIENDSDLLEDGFGTIFNSGIVVNKDGGTIDNFGVINNIFGGLIENQRGSQLNNNELFTNEGNAKLHNQRHATLENEGKLQNQEGGIIDNDGKLKNKVSGILENDGKVANKEIIDNRGTFRNNANLSELNISIVENEGAINNLGVYQNNDGQLINKSGAAVNAGTFYNGENSIFNSGAKSNIQNELGASIKNEKNTDFFNNGILENKGQLEIINGKFSNNGTLRNEGLLTNDKDSNFFNFGRIDNYVGGFLNAIINQGFFENKSRLDPDLLEEDQGFIDNKGVIINESEGIFNNQGKILSTEGQINNRGKFIGSGVVGSVNSSGTTSPGQSPGIFTITQTLTTTGTYVCELAGTAGAGDSLGHDQIVVGELATISGTLEVTLLDSFKVTVGQQFEIMKYDSLVGMFDSLNLPDIHPLTWSLQYGDSSLVLAVGSIFPVELLSFEAKQEGNKVRLNWETTAEWNHTGFEVERSADGRLWQPIGYEKGNNKGDEYYSYQFYDDQPLSGYNYYRLKDIDLDGKFHYSFIVSVHMKYEQFVILYPNPTRGEIFVRMSVDMEDSLEEVRLFNVTGSVPKIIKNVSRKGSIYMADLAAGMYVVELRFRSGEKVRKQLVVE